MHGHQEEGGGCQTDHPSHKSNTPNNSGIFSAVAESEPDFIPILPADVSAVAPAGEIFQTLGSKSDPVLHVRFPRPWSVVAHNPKIMKWRPSTKYARTLHDPDYSPDTDQFKTRLVYITPRVES